MPQSPRLNALGTLHHVIIWVVQRRKTVDDVKLCDNFFPYKENSPYYEDIYITWVSWHIGIRCCQNIKVEQECLSLCILSLKI